MRHYYKFIANTPYAGTEEIFYQMYGTDPTEEELRRDAEDFCEENANDYEYLAGDWGCEPDEDDLAIYYDDCTCEWEEISKEEYLKGIDEG